MKEVMDAMRKVRQDLEWHTYKKYAKHNHDLCGYCAVAALKLFKSLHKLLPIYIVGNEEHWFNIVIIKREQYLIDVTATQFNGGMKYELRKFPNSVYEEHWDFWHVFSDVKQFKKFLNDEDWLDSVEDFPKRLSLNNEKNDVILNRIRKEYIEEKQNLKTVSEF